MLLRSALDREQADYDVKVLRFINGGYSLTSFVVCVFKQPLITLCRCKPGNRYRPIFNWFHWLFGTVAYVLQCS